MFCFDNAFQKSLVSLSIWSFCFVLPMRFCVAEYHRNRVESSTAEKVFFIQFPRSPLKRRSSRSPKERAYSVLKFMLESILENMQAIAFSSKLLSAFGSMLSLVSATGQLKFIRSVIAP